MKNKLKKNFRSDNSNIASTANVICYNLKRGGIFFA